MSQLLLYQQSEKTCTDIYTHTNTAVHGEFVTHTAEGPEAVAEWLSYRFRSFSSPLPAIHALVSFSYWSLSSHSGSVDRPISHLIEDFTAISQPRAVYSLIHLWFPNYWSVSENGTQHNLIPVFSDVPSALKQLISYRNHSTSQIPPHHHHQPSTAIAFGQPRDMTSNEFLFLT